MTFTFIFIVMIIILVWSVLSLPDNVYSKEDYSESEPYDDEAADFYDYETTEYANYLDALKNALANNEPLSAPRLEELWDEALYSPHTELLTLLLINFYPKDDQDLLHTLAASNYDAGKPFIDYTLTIPRGDELLTRLLLVAVSFKSFKLISEILKYPVNRAITDDDGTPILFNARTKNIIELLVINGFDITQKYSDQSVMDYRIYRGKAEITDYLLDNQCPIYDINSYKYNADAICQYPLNVYQKLINYMTPDQRQRIYFSMCDEPGCTPSQIDIFKVSGCDLNELYFDGQNGLHKAVLAKNHELVDYFLQVGIDPNAVDDRKLTAAHYAIETKDARLISTLLPLYKKNGTSENIMDNIARYGDREMVTLVERHGFYLQQAYSQKKAISTAAVAGNIEMLEYLEEHDFSINQRPGDKSEETPLMYAARSNSDTGLKWLINMDATICTKSFDGNTALMESCYFRYGADEKNIERNVYHLLKAGADINAQNNAGETTLMKASAYGYAGIVKLLLKHNAKTDIQNSNKQKAIDFTESPEIIALLKGNVLRAAYDALPEGEVEGL